MTSFSQRTLSDDEQIDCLRLSRTPQVGAITFHALINRYGSAGAAIEELPRLVERAGRSKPAAIPAASELQQIEQAARLGLSNIAACEPNYPAALGAIEDAPPVIAADRDISSFRRPSAAIVGARNASLNGRKIAAKLARDLSDAGLVVVSGLARGIDTEAHKASLPSGTIAVVAGSADIVYSPGNAALQTQIHESGCVVSEAPLGTEPMTRHFPRRNRTISGIAPGVLVIEAARKSCSLITGRMALEQDREVFAVPESLLDPRAQGSNNPIRQGATLTESVEDVLSVLSSGYIQPTGSFVTQSSPVTPATGVTETQEARRRVLEALSPMPVAVDELVRDCQVSLPVVLTILLELELAGRLERQSGQRFSLIN